MAIRQLMAGMLAAALLLSGCGSPRGGDTSSASVGSASPQTQTADTQQTNAAVQEKQTQPLAGVMICLDPGHGITSASATERVSPLSQETKPAYVSGAEGEGQTEEELNLAVAELTRAQLEARGAQVVMTRQSHEATVSNQERARMANDAHVDLCIRIHADDAESGQPSGMSMQVPSGSLLGTPAIEQPSAQAAQIILQAVTQETGAQNRGLTPRSDLTGFNWSEVPCVLLEMGFLSNTEENARLQTQEYRQKIAMGIADGVCQWKQSMESSQNRE